LKVYEVGGAVRDRLLGVPVQDHDYVVVGATPQQMLDLGYRPVGADFPVFLHPQTHQEYALARTERKAGRGYHGFTFYTDASVTLEDDLRRRDLTINAIARDPDNGEFIDPFDGRSDLERGLLRHVSDAFGEDPVRILRVARFSARLAQRGFRVADETMQLMRRMVNEGEVAHLVAERVWQELARGLMEGTPMRMFEVLQACGAMPVLLPELAGLLAEQSRPAAALQRAVVRQFPLPVRFGAATFALPLAQLATLCERLRVPADCRDLAAMAVAHRAGIDRTGDLTAREALDLLQSLDVRRRPERFAELLDLCEIIHSDGTNAASYAPREQLQRLAAGLREIDEKSISQQAGFQPAMIQAARLTKIETLLTTEKS